MTQEHPITPPPELVRQWWDGAHGAFYEFEAVATQAARWGADQELEACIAWMVKMGYWGDDGKAIPALRAARRPKPPSLKEQALQALCRFDDTEGHEGLTQEQIAEDFVIIRRAIEALPDQSDQLGCPLATPPEVVTSPLAGAAVTRWPRKGRIHFSLPMPLNRASCPCPQCKALITSVLRTYRSKGGDYLRYRECEFCGHRYKTIQFAEFLAEPSDAALGDGRLFTLHLTLNVDSLRSRNPQRRNGRRLRSSIDQPRKP